LDQNNLSLDIGSKLKERENILIFLSSIQKINAQNQTNNSYACYDTIVYPNFTLASMIKIHDHIDQTINASA